jgi:hypothetical protein
MTCQKKKKKLDFKLANFYGIELKSFPMQETIQTIEISQ